MRAIQDSESPVAIDQKRVIKTLAQQGWSKNEIIYEVQRVFGNDVLIMPEVLDDERSLVGRVLPPLFMATFVAGLYLRGKSRQAGRVVKQAMDKEALKTKLRNKNL